MARYDFPGKKLIDASVDLPFALPTAVAGIALTTLYAPNGALGQIAAGMGGQIAYTHWGILIALIFVGLPFVTRTVQPVIEEIEQEVEEAAGGSDLSDLTPAHIAAFRRPTDESPLARGLLIIGVVALLAVLLYAPLIVVFSEALAKGAGAALQSLAKPEAWSVIGLTLTVAAVVLPLNAGFGIAAVWSITKFYFRGKAFLITLIDLPFSVSPVVVGLCLVLLLGANSTLGGWLVASGYPIIFALPGIVLASLFVTFPFVARELIPAMIEQGRAEEEAALTLGAGGWRVFFTVTLPKIRWALLYGTLLCNARAMGEFGAVAVVSGKIRGVTATMPITIEMLYNEYLPVSAFSLAVALALLALVTLTAKTALEWRYADQLAATHRH